MTELFSELGEALHVTHRASTPVILIGHARSGTSALASLMRKYLHIAFGTESQFIVRYHAMLHKYGNLDNDENIHRLVCDICRERWFVRCRKFGFQTSPSLILNDVRERSLAGVLDATFRQLATHMNMTRWGDKTPAYLHDLPVLYELFPDAKYIHIVRDGRDVALSTFAMSFGEKNAHCAAVEWSRAMDLVETFKQYIAPEQFLELRYEDLSANPGSVFASLISHLEIDRDNGRLLAAIESRIHGDVKPGNCDKWRRMMPRRDVSRFDSIAHPQLVRYGYESSVARRRNPRLLERLAWSADNRARKLARWGTWQDNFYKLHVRLRSRFPSNFLHRTQRGSTVNPPEHPSSQST